MWRWKVRGPRGMVEVLEARMVLDTWSPVRLDYSLCCAGTVSQH